MKVARISLAPFSSSAPLVGHGSLPAYDEPMTDCEIMAFAGRDVRGYCSRDPAGKQYSTGRPASCG